MPAVRRLVLGRHVLTEWLAPGLRSYLGGGEIDISYFLYARRAQTSAGDLLSTLDNRTVNVPMTFANDSSVRPQPLT